jgi:hypothetical protein
MVKRNKVSGFSLLMMEVFGKDRQKYGYAFKNAMNDTVRIWEAMGPEEKKQ